MIRLLCVDDDPGIRRAFARMFAAPNYQCDVADSGMSALPFLEEHDYDAIVSDFRMPRMDGGEFLARACDRRPDAVRILVTAESDFDVAVKAVNRGEVFRLVRKPWNDDDLQFAIRLGLEMRNYQRERTQMLTLLEEKTAALDRFNVELTGMNSKLEEVIRVRTGAVVETLVTSLDYRDPGASARARRVAAYARRLAVEMKLPDAEVTTVERGALLHDVGKLGIRDEILLKVQPLDDADWKVLRQHPVLGEKMLRSAEFLEPERRVVLEHREAWDGSGYPRGLHGEEIVVGARIFAVAEVIDSILSDVHYPTNARHAVARAELQRLAGRQLDPKVVAAFLAVPAHDWMELRDGLQPPAVMLEVA